MRALTPSACLAAILLLAGCSSVTYISDWDTSQSFASYQSYAWFEPAAAARRGAPPSAPNALIAGRIERAVTAELDHRGLHAAPAGEADFLVTFHTAARPRTSVHHVGHGWGYPYGYGYGWGFGGGSSYVRHWVEGTLVVDVLDGRRRRLVWRGVAEGAFRTPNPTDAEVAKVVSKVLSSFPPA